MAEALAKRKAVIKGQLTKYMTYINTKGKDATIEDLNVRLTKTSEIYKQFVEVEDQLFAIDEKVVSEMDSIDEMYFPLVSKIQGLIRKQTLLPAMQMDGDDAVNTSANNSQYFRSDFKLPRLELPVFDGNVKQWQSFYDIFVSTVHENTSLSPAQKFKYLLGQLRGAAYTSICHFRVDDANYFEAMKRLEKKYNKRKPIIETYIRDFLAAPKVSRPTANNIMKIHDSIDETIRGLRSLGQDATSRDPWIILLATDKLDEETRRLWKYESAEQDFPTIQNLLDFLSKRMDALVDTVSDPIPYKGNFNNQRQAATKSYHSAVQLPNCPLCGTEHRLFDCTKFRALPGKDRRDFISNTNRCFNCLGEGHIVINCRSSRHCQVCSRRHNTLLHFQPEPSSPVANHVLQAQFEADECKTSGEEVTNMHVTEKPSGKLVPSLTSTESKTPILPTACIEVEDKYGNWIKGRALLDSGSTHSFITENFLNLLKVSRHKSDIRIRTLNSSEAGWSRGRYILKLRSCIDANFLLSIETLVLPSITSHLPTNKPNNFKISEFNKYTPLADPTFHIPSKVDILLGCEPFFQALEEGNYKGEQNQIQIWLGHCRQHIN